ncbi:hypothetical protein GSI_02928 [Ganoderma sinense ZZ0214-1]|uniref:beta-N-acetylhexosaminidase n=1 Tax=Ganoderma sinense ZZ0214-1 TaxID=1077348 RepID=A0A2G8SN19_9APHY|nr:hypothetical protein GSI_02928 [Ganoderma sinense ZZ0214-1]
MASCAALTNPSILDRIFEYFDSDDRRDANDHLPAWARATRVLNGNIEPQEWERMRGHAEHVQTLSMTSPQTPISLTTWVYLTHLTQNCPLLPNLRLLSCKLESPESPIMIRALLSPNITDLLVSCNVDRDDGKQWEYSLRSLFDMVCSVATHLRRIDFTTGSTQQQLPVPLTVFSPIQRLKSLRILSLRISSDINFQSLRSVFFGMRSLEVVSFLNWHATDHLVDPGPLLGTFKLDRLHTLSVTNLAPSMDVKFYHCFSAPNLRVLRNPLHRFRNADESIATFSSIAESFPCLQELYLVMNFSCEERPAAVREGCLNVGTVMRPLFGLHTLVSLTLVVKGVLDTSTDAHMDTLTKSFPLLTALNIHCPQHPDVPSLSAAVLVSFAVRCPRLETLRLPSMRCVGFDFSYLDIYPVLDYGLKRLFFSLFDSEDGYFAALLLDCFFPQLVIADIKPDICGPIKPINAETLETMDTKNPTEREDEELDITDYAGARGIDVMVEIDTPGHTMIIAAAHPEYMACVESSPWSTFANVPDPPAGQLRLASPAVTNFTAEMLAAVARMFPSTLMSTGGDEINAKCYEQDAQTQADLKSSGRTLEQALDVFTQKTHGAIEAVGKTPAVWEEMVLDHNVTLSNETVVLVWLSSANAAKVAEKNFRLVHAPSDYFYLSCGGGEWIGGVVADSWCDPFKTWQKAYTFDPRTNITDSQAHLVLGGEQALWSVQSGPENLDSTVWPRAAASAEVFWTGPTGNVTEALPRLHDVAFRMRRRGVQAIQLQPMWCALRPGKCNWDS